MTRNLQGEGDPRNAWLRKMADAEDHCESVAVGGLAHELGMLGVPPQRETSYVLGRLVELARRANQMSLEQLAEKADVDLVELVAIERGHAPAPRAVYQLARTLGFSPGRLMELSGLAEPRDSELGKAAVRFAARCEPVRRLTSAEREAFEEFVKVLEKDPRRA